MAKAVKESKKFLLDSSSSPASNQKLDAPTSLALGLDGDDRSS
jgi:hypothetical protein